MGKIRYVIFFLVFSGLLTNAQELVLKDNWCIKSTLEVNADGRNISTVQFKADNWYKTSIPSTVLNTFVKNKIYPDPRIGLNDYLIRDVSDYFNAEHGLAKYSYLKNGENPWKNPYWYRTEFTLPSNYDKKNIWITFKGINYRADIWVNGHLIADHSQVVGMFRRFKFNITPYVQAGKKNCLAVKIYQVDHPGNPSPGTQFKVFGDTRGHANDIFKDETLIIKPETLEQPYYAVEISCWFWKVKHLNSLADTDNIKAITAKINGGLNGLSNRIKFYNEAITYIK